MNIRTAAPAFTQCHEALKKMIEKKLGHPDPAVAAIAKKKQATNVINLVSILQQSCSNPSKHAWRTKVTSQTIRRTNRKKSRLNPLAPSFINGLNMVMSKNCPLASLRALATDYDGTLAHDGSVTQSTLRALEKLKRAGYRLILVTGRELNDLLAIFPKIALFDAAVMENGAVLYNPATGNAKALAPAPPPEFIARLCEQRLPLQIGKCIVATWEPHEKVVLQTIKDLGLELQVVFNKGAVMILPSGVNKATGLQAALNQLEVQPLEVAGVGDAENDHAFLEVCGFSVAVANALPSVCKQVDFVTEGSHGEGVIEFIEKLLAEKSAL